MAGRLVEDLLRFNIRGDSERNSAYEKLQFIAGATGRFLRYESVARALRDLEHASRWYIRQDMKHETSEEYKAAREDVSESFKALLLACDEALRKAPNRL